MSKINDLIGKRKKLETFIECGNKYFECIQLIRNYETAAAESIFSHDASKVEDARKDLETKYLELKSSIEDCKRVDSGFSLKQFASRFEEKKKEYNSLCKTIELMSASLYDLDVEHLGYNETENLPKSLFFGTKQGEEIRLNLRKNGNVLVNHTLFGFDDFLERFIFSFIILHYILYFLCV